MMGFFQFHKSEKLWKPFDEFLNVAKEYWYQKDESAIWKKIVLLKTFEF